MRLGTRTIFMVVIFIAGHAYGEKTSIPELESIKRENDHLVITLSQAGCITRINDDDGWATLAILEQVLTQDVKLVGSAGSRGRARAEEFLQRPLSKSTWDQLKPIITNAAELAVKASPKYMERIKNDLRSPNISESERPFFENHLAAEKYRMELLNRTRKNWQLGEAAVGVPLESPPSVKELALVLGEMSVVSGMGVYSAEEEYKSDGEKKSFKLLLGRIGFIPGKKFYHRGDFEKPGLSQRFGFDTFDLNERIGMQSNRIEYDPGALSAFYKASSAGQETVARRKLPPEAVHQKSPK
jgi:hypothetical protein